MFNKAMLAMWPAGHAIRQRIARLSDASKIASLGISHIFVGVDEDSDVVQQSSPTETNGRNPQRIGFSFAKKAFTMVWRSVVSRSYCWFAPMESRPGRLNAGSFPVTSGLKLSLVAVNSLRLGWPDLQSDSLRSRIDRHFRKA